MKDNMKYDESSKTTIISIYIYTHKIISVTIAIKSIWSSNQKTTILPAIWTVKLQARQPAGPLDPRQMPLCATAKTEMLFFLGGKAGKMKNQTGK